MPDISDHCGCHSSASSSPAPVSADKPLTLAPLSSSSLQSFQAQSLLLPLPRGLRSLLLKHINAASTDAPLDADAQLSVSLTLQVDTSPLPCTAGDGEQTGQSHLGSSLLDWTALVAQLHFITQHYPASSLSTLANVIAAYLAHSNQLTTRTPPAPSPIRHLALHLSLIPPPPTQPPTTSPPHSHSASHHSLTAAQCDLPPPVRERNGWGEVDVLTETTAPSAGLYLLHVAAGQSIPSHVHRVMCEAEMVLTGGLLCQGVPAAWGAVHAWGEAVHGYTNDSDHPASVLCIDTPAFIPADEIVVTGQALAAVEVQQAGQPLWQQLARLVVQQSSGRSMPSFTFPGCYAGQSCRLSFDRSAFQPAAAVLLFVLPPPSSSAASSPSLLFVRHRVRGLELPGGKVECGESDRQAALRELREEAGIHVAEQTLQPIAQYTLTDDGGAAAPHSKSVFVAMVDAPLAADAGHRWQETDRAEWCELPSWSTVLGGSGWSVLLRDNVYAICSRVVEELWRQRERR